MGDQHDGGARASSSVPQGVGERLLVGQVDAGGRLVEDEQVRLAGQRAGDEHPLLLAAGQRGDAVAGPVGEPDDLEGVVDRRAGRRGRAGRSSRRRRQPARGHHLADAWPARRRSAVARCGTKPIRCQSRKSAQRRAEEPDGARGQRAQADQRAHQGGLAGAVGAQQRDDLALAHGQVDAAQDRPAADGDGDVAGLDDRGAGGVQQPLASLERGEVLLA